MLNDQGAVPVPCTVLQFLGLLFTKMKRIVWTKHVGRHADKVNRPTVCLAFLDRWTIAVALHRIVGLVSGIKVDRTPALPPSLRIFRWLCQPV